MVEHYVEQVHTEHAVLDIGQDVGALIIYTGPEFLGQEIEVSPKGQDDHRVHTDVLERRFNGRTIFAALYIELKAGDYTIWKTETEAYSDEVTITGGKVAELDWR